MGGFLGYFVPSVCAFTYVVGALMLKRASALGVGPWRIGFLANAAMAVLFLPWGLLYPGLAEPLASAAYWQPALSGLCFCVGQILLFLAIQGGDVSVTTPVMGAKVILVALLSLLLKAGHISWQWWLGACLSTTAVVCLHVGGAPGHRARVGRTVLLTLISAVCFSMSDVVVQKFSPRWGAGRYTNLMFLANAVYSLAFIPFFRTSLWQIERRAWGWTAAGAGLLAINNAGIVLAIAVWRSATTVNILYSLRGLISVVVVWTVGHWFGSEEQHLTPAVFRARVIGAALMLAAIILVLVP